MAFLEIEDLLTAGAHFGHLTRRWNPYMRPYIFMERNGIHIIDLKKTQILVDEARNAAERISAEGKRILFVGTKKQARDVVRNEAGRVGMNYVVERWLGGMLTNFQTIRKSIKRLTTIEKMESDGTYDQITKKERLMLSREKERLMRVLGGIVDMNRLPGALYIVDIKKEHLAVKEAKTLGIPVIAIVDTNTDPRDIDFPVPANDDSLKTIALITKVIADGIALGREASNAALEGEQDARERIDKDAAASAQGDDKNVRARRRTRSRRGSEGGDQPEGGSGSDAPAGAADATATQEASAPAAAAPAATEGSAPAATANNGGESVQPAANVSAQPTTEGAGGTSEGSGHNG
ncbi:MAG: 30S ribosomal protein S2 [bacterium]|nr:30S ribosomal protein S2 [Candidatus Kapabacteria bacterium]